MAPQTLKGFAEPVPAWLVLGESPYVNVAVVAAWRYALRKGNEWQ
jgi:hypothetical protein